MPSDNHYHVKPEDWDRIFGKKTSEEKLKEDIKVIESSIMRDGSLETVVEKDISPPVKRGLICQRCEEVVDRTWKSTVNGIWIDMCLNCWHTNENKKLKEKK